MSLIPGIAGQATVLVDGVKVDTISENTSGHGINILGKTDGSAVAAGYVGEKITWATPPTDFSLPAGVMTDWNNAYITLTKGTWLIIANIAAVYTTGTSQGYYGNSVAEITDSSNTVIQNMIKGLGHQTSAAYAVFVSGYLPFSFVEVVTTATKIYKIRGYTDSSGNGNGQLLNSGYGHSEFFGLRIA